MSRIETEHNGRKITYAENEDVWRCWDLELEAKTLSALRTKINQWDAKARRVENVAALTFDTWSHKPHETTVTLIDRDEKSVWTTGKPGRREREKVRAETLIVDTPENRKAIAAYQALANEAEAAEQRAKDARAALPWASIEDFKSVGKDEANV